jgi:hypothetical protein
MRLSTIKIWFDIKDLLLGLLMKDRAQKVCPFNIYANKYIIK